MGRSFRLYEGRALGLMADGITSFFDTDAYPVQFFPLADAISITSQDIAFPELHHTNAYAFAAGASGGNILQSCQSFVSIPFQEWGPSDQPGISDNLSDEVIGVAPAGTDMLITRVKLTRTNAPDQINGNNIPVAFKEGEWVMCDGGSLLVEFLWPIARMIWIRLASAPNVDGTINILLTRKQSVFKRNYTFWRAGNSPTSSGWTYGGTNGRYGHIVKPIQSKGPSIAIGGVLSFRRGDGGQCSLTDTSSYASDYEGDIEIIPGKTNLPVEDTGAGGGGALFFLSDTDQLNPVDDIHTYVDKFIGVEPVSGQTRHVFVALNSYVSYSSASATRDVTGVTINGVAATLIGKARLAGSSGGTATVFLTAIWAAAVPTGEEVNIVLTYNGDFWASAIDVYAAYDINSITPDDTYIYQGTSPSGSDTLSSVAGGFAIACRFSSWNDLDDFVMTGLDNTTVEEWFFALTSSRTYTRGRAFQNTDGSNYSLSWSSTVTANPQVWASFH